MNNFEVEYLNDKKDKLEQPNSFIWKVVIISCIFLTVIGWLLWETFKANMYL